MRTYAYERGGSDVTSYRALCNKIPENRLVAERQLTLEKKKKNYTTAVESHAYVHPSVYEMHVPQYVIIYVFRVHAL